MNAIEFFNNVKLQNPETCAAIVFLSSKHCTEPTYDNKEFKEAFPNAGIGYNYLLGNTFFMSEKSKATIQLGKPVEKETDEKPLRPYLLFFNKPTNCFWAMPLTTSYDLENHVKNESHYALNTELYRYIATNVKKPEFVVAAASRAIPVSKDMVDIHTLELPKFKYSRELNDLLKNSFIDNQFFKRLAFDPFSHYYTSDAKIETKTTNAAFGFFVLNFLKEKTKTLVKEACKRHTTTSSIDFLKNFQKSYHSLEQQTYALEKLLSNFAIGNYYLDRCKNCSSKYPKEKLKKMTETAAALINNTTAKISKLLPEIYSTLEILNAGDLSSFSMDVEFANKFVSCATENKDLPSICTQIQSGAKTIAEHLLKLESQKQNEIEEKRRAKLAKARKEEAEKRKKQSEKDKARLKKIELQTAMSNLEDLRKEHFAKKSLIDTTLANVELAKEINLKLESAIKFFEGNPADNMDEYFISTIKKLDPYLLNDLKELHTDISFELSSTTKELLPVLSDFFKKKKVREDDLTPELINFLKDSEKVNELISEIAEFNDTVETVQELMPVSVSTLWQQRYIPLKEKLVQMENLKSKFEIQVETLQKEFTSAQFDTKQYETDFEKTQSNAQLEELLSNISNCVEKINSDIESDLKKLETIQNLEKEAEEKRTEFYKAQKLTNDERIAIFDQVFQAQFSDASDKDFMGPHYINDALQSKYCMESKLWNGLLSLDLKDYHPKLVGDDPMLFEIQWLEYYIDTLDFQTNFPKNYVEFVQSVVNLREFSFDQINKVKERMGFYDPNHTLNTVVSLYDDATNKKIAALFAEATNKFLYEIFNGKLTLNQKYNKIEVPSLLPKHLSEENKEYLDKLLQMVGVLISEPKYLSDNQPKTSAESLFDFFVAGTVSYLTNDKDDPDLIKKYAKGEVELFKTEGAETLDRLQMIETLYSVILTHIQRILDCAPKINHMISQIGDKVEKDQDLVPFVLVYIKKYVSEEIFDQLETTFKFEEFIKLIIKNSPKKDACVARISVAKTLKIQGLSYLKELRSLLDNPEAFQENVVKPKN